MMDPLFFPFTHIGPHTVAAAARFFAKLTLYQPVAGFEPEGVGLSVGDGFLNIRIPVPDDGDLVASAVRDFQLWARQHQNRGDLRTILPGAAASRLPYFDDSATTQILSDLRPGRQKNAPHTPALFNARLFLCLAQELDRQRWELNRQLERAEAGSRTLMKELRAAAVNDGAELNSTPSVLPDDASEFMISERLRAWAQLFLADSPDNAMLLTTSPGIIADFITRSGTAAVLMRLTADELPSAGETARIEFKSALMARIESAAHQSWPFETPLGPASGDEDRAAELTIYLIPNQPLRAYVIKMAGLEPSEPVEPQRQDAGARHVVVGLLKPGGY